MTDKPFSPSCERNREPILAVLRERFAARRRVLEIGSGSGQHAVHFAAEMPWLTWQCSDVADNLPGIRAWLDDAHLANTPPPIELDVASAAAMPVRFDALFSANTLHIMGWPEVEAFFAMHDAVLTGVETRTSSPLRITRGEDGHSLNTRGLFPAGEGAGYAGGILSAGVDGIKVAEAIARSIVGRA